MSSIHQKGYVRGSAIMFASEHSRELAGLFYSFIFKNVQLVQHSVAMPCTDHGCWLVITNLNGIGQASLIGLRCGIYVKTNIIFVLSCWTKCKVFKKLATQFWGRIYYHWQSQDFTFPFILPKLLLGCWGSGVKKIHAKSFFSCIHI